MRNNLGHPAALLLVLALLSLGSPGCKDQQAHVEHDGHHHEEGEAHTAVVDGVVMCVEHGVPEAQCGICQPQRVGQLKPGESMKVRLPSPEATRIVGVQTAAPTIGSSTDGVECFAEVSFNQNALAQIVAPVSGILQSVEVDLGSRVEEGQVVAKL